MIGQVINEGRLLLMDSTESFNQEFFNLSVAMYVTFMNFTLMN